MSYNNFKDFCASVTRMQNKTLKEQKIVEIKSDKRLSFLYEHYKTPELIQFLWHLYNDIFDVQKCLCGNPLKIIPKTLLKQETNIIYQKTCGCRVCITNNTKQTNLERYGFENPMQVADIKDKYKKSIIDAYGVENISKLSDIKNNIKRTNIERYGVGCSLQAKEISIKTIQTNLERYGVINPLQNKEIRERILKTNIERYGKEYPIQNKIIRDKAINSMVSKFGVKTPIQNEDIKERIKLTNLMRYGVEYPAQNVEIFNKIKDTNIKKHGVEYCLQLEKSKVALDEKHHNDNIELFDGTGYIFNYVRNNTISLTCPNCGLEFINDSFFIHQRRRNGWELCTHCNPITSGTSLRQKVFESFFSEIYDNKLSDRKILSGKEIDVLIPKLNIGFEFNGVYWHSEKFKSKHYHQEKKFQASEQGVNLIHIWEDDWEFKREIVEARIKNVLGVTENKVFARKCSIIEVDSKTSKAFLEQNHIQGQIGAKRRLGLIYDGNLVSLMTFGVRNGKMEMLRFCNKLEYNVVGGFSRLLKHFRKEYNGEIYSYADLDWSDPKDNVYLRNGFTFVKKTEPGYFWVKNDRRYARQQFQKHKLVAQGFDASKTEDQIMIERGYVKIYNSGNLLYVIQ